MCWGLIPFWQKDDKPSYGMINARIETIDTKPVYKRAFQKHRCLVVADGFYEWVTEKNGKLPYYFQAISLKPFTMAGIYEKRDGVGEGESLYSFAIVTLDSSHFIKKYHDRMPAILPKECYDQWLDPAYGDVLELKRLILDYSVTSFSAIAISGLVNNPKNNYHRCIEPIKK